MVHVGIDLSPAASVAKLLVAFVAGLATHPRNWVADPGAPLLQGFEGHQRDREAAVEPAGPSTSTVTTTTVTVVTTSAALTSCPEVFKAGEPGLPASGGSVASLAVASVSTGIVGWLAGRFCLTSDSPKHGRRRRVQL